MSTDSAIRTTTRETHLNAATGLIQPILFVIALLTGCTQTPTPTVEIVQFTIYADASTRPLMDELATAYRTERPFVTIQLETAPNPERALEPIKGRDATLAGVSWIPDDYKEDTGIWFQTFARDSIVLVTHLANPVSGLTVPQLRSVFQGQALRWTELGGPDVDVTPVIREEGAGTRLSLEALIMGNQDVTSTAVVMPSNRAVLEFVSRTPGAIGYVASSELLPSVNVMAVEGVTPSPASVADGRYLLARPFYLVAPGPPDGGIARFVGWITEGAGHEIIKQKYALAP